MKEQEKLNSCDGRSTTGHGNSIKKRVKEEKKLVHAEHTTAHRYIPSIRLHIQLKWVAVNAHPVNARPLSGYLLRWCVLMGAAVFCSNFFLSSFCSFSLLLSLSVARHLRPFDKHANRTNSKINRFEAIALTPSLFDSEKETQKLVYLIMMWFYYVAVRLDSVHSLRERITNNNYVKAVNEVHCLR